MIDTALTIEVDHLTPGMTIRLPDNEGEWEDEEYVVTAAYPFAGWFHKVEWSGGGISLGSGREVLLVSWPA